MFRKTSTLLLSSVLASAGIAAGPQHDGPKHAKHEHAKHASIAGSSLLEGRPAAAMVEGHPVYPASAKAMLLTRHRHSSRTMLDYLSSKLALQDDQKFALHDALKEAHQEIRNLHRATATAMREDWRASLRDKLSAVLTPEQLAKFESLRQEMRPQHPRHGKRKSGHRLHRHGSGSDRSTRLESRLEFLTTALSLHDDQKISLRSILEESKAERKALRAAVHEEVATKRAAIEKTMTEKLSGFLTAEQLVRFGELKKPRRMRHR